MAFPYVSQSIPKYVEARASMSLYSRTKLSCLLPCAQIGIFSWFDYRLTALRGPPSTRVVSASLPLSPPKRAHPLSPVLLIRNSSGRAVWALDRSFCSVSFITHLFGPHYGPRGLRPALSRPIDEEMAACRLIGLSRKPCPSGLAA